MNKDNLRELWNMFPDRGSAEKKYTEEEILSLMKNRADRSLKRFNRSIYFEVIMSLVALVIILLAFYQPGAILFNRLVLTLITLLIIAYFIFFGWFYKRLQSIHLLTSDLRESLEKKIQLLNWFLKTYFWINMLIAPVIFPLSVFLGFFAGQTENGKPAGISFTDPVFFVLAAISLVLIVAFYPFLRWYIRKLYGRHVSDLQTFYDNLTGDES